MKIVVALDGTGKDASVPARVAAMARTARADVLLVHALNPWLDAGGATPPCFDEHIDEVRRCWQAYPHRRARELEELRGTPVTTLVEDQRKPAGHACEDLAGCIARVTAEHDADLLAVASKRASGIAGLLLGSTAQELLRRSPCPVLVVRPGGATAAQHDPEATFAGVAAVAALDAVVSGADSARATPAPAA